MAIGTPLEQDPLWEDQLRDEIVQVMAQFKAREIDAQGQLVREITKAISQRLAELFASNVTPVQLRCVVSQDPTDPTTMQIELVRCRPQTVGFAGLQVVPLNGSQLPS